MNHRDLFSPTRIMIIIYLVMHQMVYVSIHFMTA